MRAIATEKLFRRNGIAVAFRHFLSVQQQHIRMQPVTRPFMPAGTLILGNFILMVRKLQVIAPTVYIEYFAKIFRTHRRAFQMPARKTLAPGRTPAHDMLRRSLHPNRKICRVAFLVLLFQIIP